MCCSLAKPGTSLGEAHTPRSSTAIAEASQGKVIGSLPVGSKPPRAASTIVSYQMSKPISRASAIGSMLSSSQGNIAFSPITRVSTLADPAQLGDVDVRMRADGDVVQPHVVEVGADIGLHQHQRDVSTAVVAGEVHLGVDGLEPVAQAVQ